MNSLWKITFIFLFTITGISINSFVSATPGVIRIDLTSCYTQLTPEIQEQIRLYLDESHTKPYLEIFGENVECLRVMRLKELIGPMLQVPCHQQILINLPDQPFFPSFEQNPLIIDILGIAEYYGRYQHRGTTYYTVPLRILSLVISPPQDYPPGDDIDFIVTQLDGLRMEQETLSHQ